MAVRSSSVRGPGFSQGHQAVIRGIYADEPDPEFTDVKTFDTADECNKWIKQVDHFLLRKLSALRASRRPQVCKEEEYLSANVFKGVAEIRASVAQRLDLPFHTRTTEESTLNTLRYLYYHMKCGIFVCIQDNKLAMFIPFVNSRYTNTWSDALKMEGKTIDGFLALKSRYGKSRDVEGYIPDVSKWWANGNIICNVESDDFWGDAYLPQLKHMLQTLCDTRKVPDCEFFINKRDFPHLKQNLTEPYDFIYDKDDMPLTREKYTTYAPIVSFFVGKDFADVPFVTTDDWETATGKVFPPRAIDIRSAKNRKSHFVAWKDKIPTAFFRGNATGPGTNAQTNQRIRMAKMSADWVSDPRYNASNPIDGVRFLDAGVVGWNLRDRKLQGEPMTFIKPPEIGVTAADKVPMYAQMKYKYHIYADGHCAAMRYASMMPLGAVILKVESYTKADSMWYFPLLRPYDIRSASPDVLGDHIPVKKDLSDLAEVIEWCKTHDDICEKIAENSKSLYERLIAYEGQIDYMQLVIFEIASRFRSTLSAEAFTGGATLCASISRCPYTTADWFGADNRDYVDCVIGVSAATPPKRVDLATIGCACPDCTLKKDTIAKNNASKFSVAHPGGQMGKGVGAVITAAKEAVTKVTEGKTAEEIALKAKADKAAMLAAYEKRKAAAAAAASATAGVKRPR